ncbi:hypothetical protein SteCoe_9548 [Stentor coeruleus]|uniref:EF-hand domain-containing protein n=1 Tax=Stentor coeruleus TaxID=5963 RepID=A0A1R2CHT0_9CILI|nr:hypothetical protein SteCoe_9548 [Stentor coeruleus]
MGCCESGRAQEIDSEDIIFKVEISLNLFKLSARDIDRLAHRFCTNLIITKAHFSAICKELKLEPDSLAYEFLETFYDPLCCGYPVVRLSTLGILLGSGSQNSKLILLFKNYDIDLSNMLEQVEIRKMCDDVVSISFQHIVSFASRKCSENIQLAIADYRTKLTSIKNTVAQYFTNIIMQDKRRISLNEFTDVFQKSELESFLTPHNLRISSRGLLKVVFRTVEAVNIMMSEDIAVDKELEDKLCLRFKKNTKKNDKSKSLDIIPVTVSQVK